MDDLLKKKPILKQETMLKSFEFEQNELEDARYTGGIDPENSRVILNIKKKYAAVLQSMNIHEINNSKRS